jgi:DNA-binding CsgD family transcriptional regulator
MKLRNDRWSDRVPDGIEPIVGYRMWGYAVTHGRGELHSFNCHLGDTTCPWESAGSSWVVALCSQDRWRHAAPDENCTCGFYAMNELARLVAVAPLPLSVLSGIIPIEDSDEDDMMVMGRVELAGKVIEHEYGYRAERARVAELIPFQGTERAVMRLANRLQVPIGPPVEDLSLNPDCPRPLSPREHEIVLGVADGISTKEVAEGLSIAPESVRRHLEEIFKKIAANSQTQAMTISAPASQEPKGDMVSAARRILDWLGRPWPSSSSD